MPAPRRSQPARTLATCSIVRRVKRLLWILVVVGCKDDPNAKVCAHYAELVQKCTTEEENKSLLRDTADNLCRKGMSGEHEQMFGARYRAMIECTRTAKTCEEYEKCIAP